MSDNNISHSQLNKFARETIRGVSMSNTQDSDSHNNRDPAPPYTRYSDPYWYLNDPYYGDPSSDDEDMDDQNEDEQQDRHVINIDASTRVDGSGHRVSVDAINAAATRATWGVAMLLRRYENGVQEDYQQATEGSPSATYAGTNDLNGSPANPNDETGARRSRRRPISVNLNIGVTIGGNYNQVDPPQPGQAGETADWTPEGEAQRRRALIPPDFQGQLRIINNMQRAFNGPPTQARALQPSPVPGPIMQHVQPAPPYQPTPSAPTSVPALQRALPGPPHQYISSVPTSAPPMRRAFATSAAQPNLTASASASAIAMQRNQIGAAPQVARPTPATPTSATVARCFQPLPNASTARPIPPSRYQSLIRAVDEPARSVSEPPTPQPDAERGDASPAARPQQVVAWRDASAHLAERHRKRKSTDSVEAGDAAGQGEASGHKRSRSDDRDDDAGEGPAV